jgi:hypothetical protein
MGGARNGFRSSVLVHRVGDKAYKFDEHSTWTKFTGIE